LVRFLVLYPRRGATQHLEAHEQDYQPAGSAERRNRNAEGGQNRAPAERGEGENHEYGESGPYRYLATLPLIALLGEAQEKRYRPEWVCDSQHGDDRTHEGLHGGARVAGRDRRVTRRPIDRRHDPKEGGTNPADRRPSTASLNS